MEHQGRSSRRFLLGVCLLLALKAGRAPGQPITLVKDLRTTPEALWVQPSSVTAVGSAVFFVASGEATGSELWASDGTPAGTRMVKDIRPGKEGSNVQQLTNVNGTLFFQADDGTNGAELWKSDGTAAGTVMVKDIWGGPDGTNPWSLAAIGGVVYFSANDGGPAGQELWRSDGTAAGTWRVKDIAPGNASSNPSNLVAVGATLYFAASDPTNGQELWKSDGTESGTVLVKDLCAGSCGSNPSNILGVGSFVSFSANDGTNGQELWKTDGTTVGTEMVKDVRTGSNGSSPQLLTNVGGVLYFTADDGVAARELWKSDGTNGGTLLVKDVCPGACPSNLNNLVALGGALFFSASDGVSGRELWTSDGTEGGTALVKDLCPGITDSVVTNLTVLSGKLYFQANDCASGVELWTSDGTAVGTQLVKDICPGSCPSTPTPIAAAGTNLFFGANDGTHGPQLWKSDGTDGGTVILTSATVLSSFAGALTDLSGTLIFAAYDPSAENRTLWKTDGSPAGTAQLAVGRLYYPANLAAWGGKVFLSGDSGGGNYELWSTDGTEPGSAVVKEICPGGCSSNPSLLTPTDGPLFFVANDGTSGNELWKSDGTEPGTLLVKDIWPGSGSPSIQSLTRVGSRVFFTAMEGTNGRELWVSDGTLAGTTIVKDLWPGSLSSNPQYLTDVNGTLFFTASDGTGGNYLFRSDGTAAGTSVVSTVYSKNLANVNGLLYFWGSFGGSELWKSDGTPAGTVLVRDINTAGSSNPTYLTAAGPYVYFRATDGTSGVELWRSDGTTAGTIRVRDINPGAGSSLPRNLTTVGTGLFFVANDGVHGEELWKTDGTEAGTFMVQDLNPGAAHSNIGQLLLTAARLYLTADDGVVGQELWKLGTIDLGVVMTASSPFPFQGSLLVWRMTVPNSGPSAATGVTLTDTLPAGVTVLSSNPGAPTCTLVSGTLTCALGTIAATANAVVTINVTVNVGFTGTLTNLARVTALEPDSSSANDSASVTVTVPGPQPATNLTALATSASSITLSWTDSPSTQTGVRVERSTDGATWAAAGSVGAHVTTFTNTPLSAGTLYYYRVVVVESGVGESAPSNVAVARTFPATAAKVCATRLGPHHTWSRYPAVAWNGVNWGMVAQVRGPDRELDDVFFHLLDGSSGHLTGSVVNVSDDDVNSSYPSIRWNGSRFAVVWYPGIRGAAGQIAGQPRLTLLDADGIKVRGDVGLGLSDSDGPVVYINDNFETAMAWTGSEWGFVFPAATGGESQIDLYFVRASPEGDRIGAPVRLTNTPEDEYDVSLAWNGTEYGVSWVWFGGPPTVNFQRMQTDGTLIGTPTVVMANPNGVSVTSAVWDGTGWAAAFTESGTAPDYPSWTNLARLNANGSLNGSPVRVSPDYDPGFPPGDQKAIYDELSALFSKPGGGYVVFGNSQANVIGTSTPPTYEISRYETDAAGARIGTRTILSTDDLRHSVYGRGAFDGSRYLVVYNDGSPGTQEVARVIAGASGPPLAGASVLSGGGSPGNTWAIATSSSPLTLPVGDGFAVVWGEAAADLTYQLGTKVFDGAGNVSASRWPISTRTFRARPGGVGAGDTFALAWKDSPNNVIFDRYDATGASLLGEVVVATGQGGRPGVGVAFSSESYGLTWIQGSNLAFQRVASNGALIGTRTTVALGATPANVVPQITWTGTGWAVVYVLGTDLQYILFSPTGAVSVSPVALTASTSTKSALSIAWSGTKLGVAWVDNPNVAPWADILFTSVGSNGVKDFAPVNVASSAWNEGNPSLYWDTDRFRLVHTFGQTAFLREIGIHPNGTLAGAKFLANRGGANSVAFNGVTAGIAWQQMNDDYFETAACTADTTQPPCPSASASVSGKTATIGWTPVADAESGLYRYYVYRDGLTLAEVFPSTTTIRDGGFPPGVTHSYEVRAYNGAWLESTGCTACSPSTDFSVSKSDGSATEVPGTSISYTITVTNGGPSSVTSVTLTDPVPAALTGAVFTPAAGSWNSGTGLWSGLSLAPGQSASMTLAAMIDPAARGTLSNTATVAPTVGVVDPNGANDTATDLDTLVPSANLSVSIADAPDPVLQGATLTYSLSVGNAGPSTATAAVLTVTLPSGVTFLSSLPGSPTCIHASGTVTCDLGGLAVGGSASVTVNAKPNAGIVGTITATATVAAVESDPDGANNTASAQTTVPGPAPARDVRVTARTTTTVSLKWTDPQGLETGFRVERSTDGAVWGAITIVGQDVTTHTDSGRSPATLYFYRVVALQSGVGESAPSNSAWATTLATVAATVCATPMGPAVGGASGPSLAWSGTSWAAAWTDRRDGLLEEVYFQRIDSATGSPLGSQVRVSSTGASSSARSLRWNGSRYGLLWTEHPKPADGNPVSDFRFTAFDGAGSRLQGDVSAFRLDNELFWSNQETPLVWNGGGWGVFLARASTPPADIRYYRLDETGRPVGAPVAVTATPEWEMSVSAAWSGSAYGVTWVKSGTAGGTYQVLFQRVALDGTPLGSPVLVWQNTTASPESWLIGSTSILWDGSSWVVAFTDVGPDPDEAEAIYLRRLDAAGTPVGAAVRLSPDYDPDFPPADLVPVYDRFPVLFTKPGGGYVVFTSSWLNTTGLMEACRYEAAASFVRVGTRTQISTGDGRSSAPVRAATDGSRSLVSWNESRSGTPEIAAALVDASGAIQAGPAELTSSHPSASSSNPVALALGNGFGALYTASASSAVQPTIAGQFWEASGALVATRSPLSARSVRGMPGAVAVGSTFALAWKDSTNTLVFARYDATGAPLVGEATVATGAGGRTNVGLAFSGDVYGVAFFAGNNLSFQRVAPDGSLVGSRATVTTTSLHGPPGPQIQWVGTGWAIVWLQSGNLFYARLDPAGTVAVPPIQVTFTAQTEAGYQLLWTGAHLGLTWYEYMLPDPPGGEVLFTVLSLDGIKAFEPVSLGSTSLDDSNPSPYWDVDRFRVVMVPGIPNVLREVAVLPDGAAQPGEKTYFNRGGVNGVAWNGATLGLAWRQLGFTYFETTACLADATPPPCPDASAVFDGSKTTVSWTPVTDAESGIWSYGVTRDGLTVAEEAATTTSWADTGPVPGVNHSYQVRALNRAMKESTGCSGVTPSADVSLGMIDVPDPVQPAGTLTYTLTVSNAGPSSASNVTLTDTLPAGVAFVSATPSSPTCVFATGTVTCSLGTLSSGQSTNVTIVVTMSSSTPVTNTASVTAQQPDPVSANNSASATTTVCPGAPVATSNAPLCAGGNLQLSASTVAGGTYSWTGPNGFASNSQNPIIASVTTLASGTYSVTVTVGGCTSAAGTTDVLVYPKPVTPVITAPASVGPGQSFTASVPDVAGVSYAWIVTNGTVTAGGGTRQITVTAGATGPVTISVTETNTVTTCVSVEASVSIPVALLATRFYPVTPCRLFDTRESTGTSAAAPILAPGEVRTFTVGTRCGLSSSTIRSLSVNQTVTMQTANGELVLYRGDLSSPPITSNVSYRTGLTRANNGILELSRNGDGTFKVQNRSTSSVHFILDVNGAFQ